MRRRMRMDSKQVILIVEDSPEDYEATKRGFRESGLANPIFHCEDGDEALDFLFRHGKYGDPEKSPRPGIILLDLNLPGTDGFEVLREIKNNDELKKIPLVVLTTSSDERDIERCYANGASSYIVKPVSFSGFMDAMQRFRDYWFEIAVLPKQGDGHG
jgi:CheY-like chemotaxis protein